MPEKRQFVRHPSSIPIEVRLLAGGRAPACASDIGLGGLAFEYHWPISLGVELGFIVPRLAAHIELCGRVVRCERKGEVWVIGIAFEGRGEVFRMRMVQQICLIEEYRRRECAVGRDISSDKAAAEWVARHANRFPLLGV